MKRLVVSDRAITDMAEILEFIRKDRPKASERLYDRLWREFDQLCAFPNLGHRRADVRDTQYRFKRVKSFLVAYRLDGDDLRVVRVLHGARDFRQVRFE
ncbi:MAG: hypothetical protein FLDDKLPJ_01167 [Phycisphaerae bacterium]|nr:hypothetical protein [Phycisphaerae bacterium]